MRSGRRRSCSPRSRRKILSGGDLWLRPDPDSRWIQFWEAKISGATCAVSSGPTCSETFDPRQALGALRQMTYVVCVKSTVEPANTQRPSTRYKPAAPLNLKLPSLNIWDKSNSKLFMFCLLAGLQGSDSAAPDIVVHEPFPRGFAPCCLHGCARIPFFTSTWDFDKTLFEALRLDLSLFIRTGLVVFGHANCYINLYRWLALQDPFNNL